MYGVYDVKEKERCCGVFDSKKDVKMFLDVEYNVLSNALKRNGRVGRRFEICEIDIEE